MSDAKNIRQRFANKEKLLLQREFLAPFDESSKKVHVKIDGLIYPFRIIGQRGSGFGVFKPVDPTCAKYVREASFETSRAFLDVLPSLHLILAYQTEQGWISHPANQEQARKRFGLESAAVVKNVSDCDRFDTTIARFDGVHFWYDGIFMGGNPRKSHEMRECFIANANRQTMAILAGIRGITPEDRKSFDMALSSWAMFRRISTEDRIRVFIEQGGGRLGNFVLRGVNVEVKWTADSGRQYTSLVNKDSLDVVSAGICLAGEDKKFHLKDLPYIIRDGEDRNLIHVTR